MATQIVSGNLNVKGNNGQYETDPSTWGFGSFTFAPITIGRAYTYKSAGLYSLYAEIISQTLDYVENVEPRITTGVAGFPITAGKKYVAKAKVRTRTEVPVATDNVLVYIAPISTASMYANLVKTIELTIFDIKDPIDDNNWFDLETTFEAAVTAAQINLGVILELNPGDSLNVTKRLYVDQFEVYEYAEVEEEPSCTLKIDEANTVVVNETSPAANDGSITVATTAGTGPFQYQLNGGAWQSSNQFTGLDSGLHTIKVREQATPSCEDTAVFSVNATAIDFDFTLVSTDETVSGANDGMITASVTGEGGPFTFSIDGGEYQGSNAFTDLAPGTYFVTVKNAAGDTLTKQASIAAGVLLFEKVFFSKNPITLARSAAAGWEELNNYRYYDDVRVEDETGSSQYNSKLQVEQPPASDGSVLFSVRRAFRDVLSAVPPTLNQSAIVRLTDRVKVFKHFTGELQNDEITPAVLTPSNPFLVMMGGLSTLKHPQIDFFGSYMQANKKFMTWAPTSKNVDRFQEDYLNFWIYSPSITVIKQRIKAYFDDGTDQTSTVLTQNNVAYGQLYQIPAGPANCAAVTIDGAKNVVKYEISMLDQSDAVISEVRTYILVSTRHPLSRFFMFLNSLGAYEVHLFTGAARETTDFEGTPFEKYLAPDYTVDDVQFGNDQVTFQNKGSFSTGFLKGRFASSWLAYLRDMLRSQRFFDVTTGHRVPMIITSRSMTYKEDQNYERFLRFEAAEAYMHESYTPEDV